MMKKILSFLNRWQANLAESCAPWAEFCCGVAAAVNAEIARQKQILTESERKISQNGGGWAYIAPSLPHVAQFKFK